MNKGYKHYTHDTCIWASLLKIESQLPCTSLLSIEILMNESPFPFVKFLEYFVLLCTIPRAITTLHVVSSYSDSTSTLT